MYQDIGSNKSSTGSILAAVLPRDRDYLSPCSILGMRCTKMGGNVKIVWNNMYTRTLIKFPSRVVWEVLTHTWYPITWRYDTAMSFEVEVDAEVLVLAMHTGYTVCICASVIKANEENRPSIINWVSRFTNDAKEIWLLLSDGYQAWCYEHVWVSLRAWFVSTGLLRCSIFTVDYIFVNYFVSELATVLFFLTVQCGEVQYRAPSQRWISRKENPYRPRLMSENHKQKSAPHRTVR